MRCTSSSRLLLTAVALAIPACECIDVPEHDSAPPLARLLVTFTDPDAAGMVLRQVDVTSSSFASPPDLRLPQGWPIQVIFSSHDSGGVQMLRIDLQYLDPTTIHNADGTITHVLIEEPERPDGDFSECAMEDRVLSFDWAINGHWAMTATAIDFHGNEETTLSLNLGEG